MSSQYSTITSNINLLLVDTTNITSATPYVAYISSVSLPGRIATVRDATGNCFSNRNIILSTTKNVRFSDGTSSITINQPFGFISLSSRDASTWNVINTFAFPNPYGTAQVSSVYVNDAINVNSIFSRLYISTPFINVHTISTINLRASTISSGLVLANKISTNSINSVNAILSNISSQTLSTTNLFASLISTNRLKTNTIGTSTVTFNTGVQNSVLSLSNDGQALLVNGIPTGTYRSISTATTNLNMNNYSISNVDNINTTNLSATYLVAINLSAANLASIDIFTDSIKANSMSTNSISTSIIQTNSISSFNIKANRISTNTLLTNNINLSSIAVYDTFNNTNLKAIYANNSQLFINNQLNVTPYSTFTQSLINTGVLDNCNNNITNVNTIYAATAYTNSIYPFSFSANLSINMPLDMNNYSITNLSQTTAESSAATNGILPRSLLITTSDTASLNNTGYTKLAESASPFTKSYGFSKYKISFYFSGNTYAAATSNTAFYCVLSNTNTAAIYQGSNVAISPLQIPIEVSQSWVFSQRTRFQYTDIFDLTGITDPLSVLLYGTTSSTTPYAYTNVKFYISYQPLIA